VTRDRDGAIVRGGGLKVDVPGRPAELLSAVGAGDVFCGVLLASLSSTDFYAPAIAAALPQAVAEAAGAVERWGALE
jgi:sugar/nucleoside kinase (ribokinase family)